MGGNTFQDVFNSNWKAIEKKKKLSKFFLVIYTHQLSKAKLEV
jgi:hypothetical protein